MADPWGALQLLRAAVRSAAPQSPSLEALACALQDVACAELQVLVPSPLDLPHAVACLRALHHKYTVYTAAELAGAPGFGAAAARGLVAGLARLYPPPRHIWVLALGVHTAAVGAPPGRAAVSDAVALAGSLAAPEVDCFCDALQYFWARHLLYGPDPEGARASWLAPVVASSACAVAPTGAGPPPQEGDELYLKALHTHLGPTHAAYVDRSRDMLAHGADWQSYQCGPTVVRTTAVPQWWCGAAGPPPLPLPSPLPPALGPEAAALTEGCTRFAKAFRAAERRTITWTVRWGRAELLAHVPSGPVAVALPLLAGLLLLPFNARGDGGCTGAELAAAVGLSWQSPADAAVLEAHLCRLCYGRHPLLLCTAGPESTAEPGLEVSDVVLEVEEQEGGAACPGTADGTGTGQAMQIAGAPAFHTAQCIYTPNLALAPDGGVVDLNSDSAAYAAAWSAGLRHPPGSRGLGADWARRVVEALIVRTLKQRKGGMAVVELMDSVLFAGARAAGGAPWDAHTVRAALEDLRCREYVKTRGDWVWYRA